MTESSEPINNDPLTNGDPRFKNYLGLDDFLEEIKEMKPKLNRRWYLMMPRTQGRSAVVDRLTNIFNREEPTDADLGRPTDRS